MERPSINFQSGGTIVSATTNYAFEVQPGVPYVLAAHGNFDSATVTMLVYDPVKDTTYEVAGGEWNSDFETRFVSPYAVVLLTIGSSGGGTSIAVTYTPIRYTVK